MATVGKNYEFLGNIEQIETTKTERLIIENGPNGTIKSTNFFETEYSQKGVIYVSFNQKTFRVFLPPSKEQYVSEMKTYKEIVITQIEDVSKVPLSVEHGIPYKLGTLFAQEFMFDDFSDRPFAFHIKPQVTSIIKSNEIRGNMPCNIIVYKKGLEVVVKDKCFLRKAPSLPWLKPLK